MPGSCTSRGAGSERSHNIRPRIIGHNKAEQIHALHRFAHSFAVTGRICDRPRKRPSKPQISPAHSRRQPKRGSRVSLLKGCVSATTPAQGTLPHFLHERTCCRTLVVPYDTANVTRTWNHVSLSALRSHQRLDRPVTSVLFFFNGAHKSTHQKSACVVPNLIRATVTFIDMRQPVERSILEMRHQVPSSQLSRRF